jgi:hypothetical protein
MRLIACHWVQQYQIDLFRAMQSPQVGDGTGSLRSCPLAYRLAASAAATRSGVIFAAISATVPSGEGSSSIASCRALSLRTGVAAGGLVYHYCGGWAYKYGYAPYSCYIFGGW